MDILKKDNYRQVFIAIFIVTISVCNIFANEKQSIQILIDSYNLPDKLTLENTEKTLSDLNRAIDCNDNYLKFSLKYRIGMLYFKTNDFIHALDNFEKIARSTDCPDTIRLCSLNMTGQIYRMQGDNSQALDAFKELIDLSKKFSPKDVNSLIPSVTLKLAVTAGFAKAEIYQYQKEYDSAISEYKRILTWFEKELIHDANGYLPVALDRMSQLYLIKGDIEAYNQTTDELITKYTNYYRISIIRLETYAVKILKQKVPSSEFTYGSFEAPARLIDFIKNNNDKELIQTITVLLQKLCNQYHETYGGIILRYHYAWLLDMAGQKDSAAKTFEEVSRYKLQNTSNTVDFAAIVDTLCNYAMLQQAVILGEQANYKEALEITSYIKTDQNDIHLSTITNSIKQALETLKREVPKDVNIK